MSANRHGITLLALLAVGTAAVLAASAVVFAQDRSHIDHAHHILGSEGVMPTLPGQDAFGAIQEIVGILTADPKTDWSKIDLGALREHLIDMSEVTLRSATVETKIDRGVQIDVTGSGRTLAAIQRMLPAHARELNELRDWQAKTDALPEWCPLDGNLKYADRGCSRSWARLHRPHGERIAPPAAPSRHGKGRAPSLRALGPTRGS